MIEAVDYRVKGLRGPVELIVDEWGIPHLYAENVDDVFFAQGFNAARDRLFQIDLWRRRGLGQLAEAFGPEYAEQDRAARLFSYRGDLQREWASYGPDAEQIATQFTHGINAYVDWLDDHPDQLPPEFGMLEYRPAKWAPEDVVRVRSHAIIHNVTSELARATFLNAGGGSEADKLRRRIEPEHDIEVPDGLDLDIPSGVLRTFALAAQQVVFTGDPREPLLRVGEGAPPPPADVEGSNNWTIHGTRTATGRPILANDPHRAFSTPSLRYVAHLVAPGLDVIGAGEPALPGVSIGHNGTIAFGLTIFPIDGQDVYVYDLDPDDHTRYRYQDTWENLEIVTESLTVRGEDDRKVDLTFTRHGPVVHTDVQRSKAYVVRSTWSEPGTAAYFGSIGYMRARSWPEFREALANWGAPGENQVYADIEGNIGWKAAGFVPKRVGYDGLLPVPGDGRYEWDGFVSSADFPEIFNPAEGFWATANQFNLPDGYPAEHALSYEWFDPGRYQRMVEVLAANDNVTMQDAMRLQTDVNSLAAREVVAALRDIAPDDDVTTRALELLTSWDGETSAESAGAALFEVWIMRHFARAYLRMAVPPAGMRVLETFDYEGMRESLRKPGPVFGVDAERKRDELVLSSLRAAYADLEEMLGDDPAAWRWGDVHRSTIPHPLGFLDPSLEPPSLPMGGSGTTVNVSGYRLSDFLLTAGASFRTVIDVGEWDNSVVINTPGQSGNPGSKHYFDLHDKWHQGEYVPLLYSREAVERHADERHRLLPE